MHACCFYNKVYVYKPLKRPKRPAWTGETRACARSSVPAPGLACLHLILLIMPACTSSGKHASDRMHAPYSVSMPFIMQEPAHGTHRCMLLAWRAGTWCGMHAADLPATTAPTLDAARIQERTSISMHVAHAGTCKGDQKPSVECKCLCSHAHTMPRRHKMHRRLRRYLSRSMHAAYAAHS